MQDSLDTNLRHPESKRFRAGAGFIGSRIVNKRGEGILRDILLGLAGAFAGGWLFRMFGLQV
jgi:uncharacterized membrane protein YeaQ/YmgE (transglycosylase-associated protein family)